MLIRALEAPAARRLCDHAARLVGMTPVAVRVRAAPGELGALAGDGQRPALLVHDFAPSPGDSIAWLDAVAAAAPRVSAFALLDAPAGAAVDLLVRAPRHFHCVGVALAAEERPESLAPRLAAALRAAHVAAVLDVAASAWELDPLLTALARRLAASSGAWPTLDRLLHDAGVGRRAFVRHARAAGFAPPLRFVHGLRVLAAHAALRGGAGSAATARRFGYASVDTLRRHFRETAGLTPRESRHVPSLELARRMRRPA